MIGSEPDQGLRRIVVGLVMLAAVLAAMRLYTWNEPIERDIGFYAAIGHELALGKLLYTEAWDHYLPGITSTYMAAEWAFGYGSLQLYMLWTVAALVTLGGVYLAASSGPGSARGRNVAATGGLAACLFVAVAGDMMLQANQPNTETFINACVVWAFALLVRYPATGSRPRSVAIGLLLAMAILYKQVALFPAAALVVAHVLMPAGNRRRALLEGVWMGATGLAVGLGLLAYITVTGRFQAFWDNVIMYSLHWADLNRGSRAGPLQLFRLWAPEMLALSPLLLLAVAGVVAVRGWSRRGVLLAAWFVGTWIAIAAPGTFFPHYYQLWIPVLAVAAAWSFATLLGRMPRAAVAAACVALLGAVLLQIPGYTVPPREWPLRKYGEYGQLFVDAQRAGRAIGETLAPDERFWQWGYEPQLYFYSGRRPAASVLLLFPMTDGPVAQALSERVLRELQSRPPELIVTHPLYALPPGTPITTWIERRYRAAPDLGDTAPFVLHPRGGWRPPRELRRDGAR